MTTGTSKHLYTYLGELLVYPKEDIRPVASECLKALEAETRYPPEVLEEFKRFNNDLGRMTLDDLQQVYSYTFELTSDYTLDMGFHVFDGFKRSNSLASIKAMYKDKGFPYEEISKGELPDHLPVLLHFLGFVDDEELKRNFRESFIIKAMEKLYKNFEKNKKNIYSHLISVIYRVLDKDVKEV